MNRQRNFNIWLVACTLIMTLTGSAGAVTRYVSPDQSIQAAIDASSNGNQIEVAPGTYNEAIDFKGKAIRLYSSDGPAVTVIDANELYYHVVQCVSTEGPDTILEGFTITGGNANGPDPNDTCGGGMFNAGLSPTVTDCAFSSNLACWGGGMYDYQSEPSVAACDFHENEATVTGGGMFNNGSSPIVTNCTFGWNWAADGTCGGMDNYYSSTPTVTNCTFTGNVANEGGGGMYNYSYSSPTVTSCAFFNNEVLAGGGGIYNYFYSSPTLTNCTFTGNRAYNYGGIILNYVNCQLQVYNCILWRNSPYQICNYSSSHTYAYFSDIEGGFPGLGNIDANPNFADTFGGNLRLAHGSPCIDAGQNYPVSVTSDLNGWSRFIDDLCTTDTGRGMVPIVDMGAYEFLPADMDDSGFVNLLDYRVLAAYYLQTGGDPQGADMNCNGSVDLEDLAALVAHWLEGKDQ